MQTSSIPAPRPPTRPAARRPARNALLVGLLLLAAPFAWSACGDEATGPTGTLEVAVYQDGRTGAAGKQIEVRDTSQAAQTNDAGLATFTLAAGRYTVRAYEIGTPGPGMPYVEQTIGVTAGKTSHVEFFDCVLCR